MFVRVLCQCVDKIKYRQQWLYPKACFFLQIHLTSRFLAVMVIKTVVFEGHLSRYNSLDIVVNEKNCCLRSGNWRMRLDSLAVTVTSAISLHVTVGCNLVRSPQTLNDRITVEPTPLHLFTLEFSDNFPQKKQLLTPGQTEWHFFNGGSQEVAINFRDVKPLPVGQFRAPMNLYACGILLLECIG